MLVARPAAGAAGWWRNLIPGQYVVVWYADDNVYHERLLLHKAYGSNWVMESPDGDQCIEDLSGGDPEGLEHGHKVADDGQLPTLGAGAYRFGQYPSQDALKNKIRAGRREAAKVCEDEGRTLEDPTDVLDATGNVVSFADMFGGGFLARRLRVKGVPAQQPAGGIPTPLGPAPAAPSLLPAGVAPGQAADRSHVWLACDAVWDQLEKVKLGQEMTVTSANSLVFGDSQAMVQHDGVWVRCEKVLIADAPGYAEKRRQSFRVGNPPAEQARSDLRERLRLPGPGDAAAVPKAETNAAGEDVRTLWVEFDEQGERFKRWRVLCQELTTQHYKDTPLEGPPTQVHLAKHMERHGGDPRLWLQLWQREKKLESTDRVIHEMKVLIDTLYYAGAYDCLNLGALISIEIVCRRIQTIVDAYSNPARPNWENARIFSGSIAPEDCIAPGFRTWAVRKAKDEAEIAAARSKTRELRGGAGAGGGAGGGGKADEAEAVGGLPGGGRGGGRDGRKGGGRGRQLAAAEEK